MSECTLLAVCIVKWMCELSVNFENLSGVMKFHTVGRGDTLATLRNICNEDPDDACGVIEVEVVTLDKYFGTDIHIHLLKIDAEGFDPLVLQGGNHGSQTTFDSSQDGLRYTKVA